MADHRPTPVVPVEIVTERLLLRPMWEADADAMIDAIDESRRELTRWMAWAPSMRTPDDALNMAARVRLRWDAAEDFGIGIFRQSDGRFLGGTGLHRPIWQVPSLEIGYWMRTSEVGKGYVREAVTALTRVGFGQMGLRRVAITCADTNVRSQRVAESVGYAYEGRLRNDDRLPGGELRDTLVYALIDTDETVATLLQGDD